jgi:hypothetical protein
MSHNASNETGPSREIQIVLKDLLKVIKVVSMYPPDNPLPQSLKQSFAERLVDLVSERHGLSLRIEKGKMFEGKEAVFEDHPPDEALAAILFDAGITRLEFSASLNCDNVHELLEVFRRHQNREDNSGDLASAFWQANIGGFSFKTVEDVALAGYTGKFKIQEIDSDDSGDDNSLNTTGQNALYETLFVGVDYENTQEDQLYDDDTITGRRIEQSEVEARQLSTGDPSPGFDGSAFFDNEKVEGVETAVQAMGFDDFKPVAIPKLDTRRLIDQEYQPTAQEKSQLVEMLNRDSVFDIYESTVELLKEMLHQENDLGSFGETVTICEKLITTFLRNGRIAIATDLLGYMHIFRDRLLADKPQWATRLQESVTTLGSRDRLEALASGLNAHPEISGEQVTAYLFGFDWRVLAGLSAMVTSLGQPQHRQAILDLMSQRGGDHIAIISRNLLDKQPETVCNAIEVLGRIGTADALEHFKKIVTHKDQSVRTTLVRTLAACNHDIGLDLLVTLTRDEESAVRAEAVASIAVRRGPQAFAAVDEIINDESFARLSEEDRQALLTAYSVLGGDHAVDYLADLATRSNPLGDASLKFYRDAAFVALAHNRSEKSERVLVKMAGSWRPDLKRHAQDAIKLRRDLLYGANHG